MTESEVKQDIIKYLKKIGVHHDNILQGSIKQYGNKKGISDILCCYRGRYVAIEVKGEGGKPSQDQIDYMESVKNSGGIAIDVYSLDEVKGALRAIT